MRSQCNELKNQALIKSINRAKILNCIRESKTIARAQIAEKLGLDRKSLTNFISELQQEGIVLETGKLLSGGLGRPFTMLEFCRDKLVLGIAISPDFVHGVRMDLYGKIAHSYMCKDAAIASDRERLFRAVQEVYEKLKPHGGVMGKVGISLPGLIDGDGILVDSANMPSLVGLNCKSGFSFINEEVQVEDSSRAALLAEKWFGVARTVKDIVFVELGTGIGAGIMINNRLFRGGGHFSGEIGHVTVSSQGGALCRCGKKDCLETFISSPALLRQINAALGSSYASLDAVPLEVADKIVPLLSEAGAHLGRILGMLINVLSPNLIVLSGPLVSRFGGTVLPSMERETEASALRHCFSAVKILPSSLSDIAVLGAGTLALSGLCEVSGYYHIGD
ncbi:MAG: hypothetical protein A2X49_01565 [Lentisphaerae bacterium GWF2_52_8]|nr:MAG: hypothetical protein A2X49_01565 [Lentisphaerae bacterium GWF2_52_8]